MFRWLRKEAKISYSQCGEDLIVDFLLQAMRIRKPTYLDIGAHHPTYISNTFLFYEKGCSGVCIEPDPTLMRHIKKVRKNDICLNVGVGVGAEEKAKFYLLTSRTLNTFSLEEATRYQTYGGQKIEEVIDVPLVPINKVISDYFSPCPNFVSLDVEGMDYEIIKSFDFSKYRPEVFCIETLTYTEDKTERKIVEIIDYMKSRDYVPFADTYINTIFVDSSAWSRR